MENKMPLLGKIKCRDLWKIVYHLHLMTTAEIHTRLQEGFKAIEAGRVQDAKAAFAAFRESHR
jgi:hypothetical protein